MGVDHALRSDLPQPAQKGKRPLAEEVVEPAVRFDQGFLNDVGGINPSGEPFVQPPGNHPAQMVTIVHQQPLPCGLISPRCALDKLVDREFRIAQSRTSSSYYGNPELRNRNGHKS
jgi:hypothetical protein